MLRCSEWEFKCALRELKKQAVLHACVCWPGRVVLTAVLCMCMPYPPCREVVSLLRELKKQATLLVVSHDLADIAPLVDCAWRMQVSGGEGLEPPVLELLLCTLN